MSEEQTKVGEGLGASSSSSSSSLSTASTGLSSFFSSLAPSQRYIALQAAASALAGRFQFSRDTGFGFDAFEGLRNYLQALGFKQTLTIQDYRSRYQRGGIAKVLIDRLPEEMWDDGVFILEEDSDPENLSEFESQSAELWKRLNIESRLMKADKLAGLSIYSAVLIGVKEGPGKVDYSQPLPRLKGPDDIIYLLQYAEDNAKVVSLVKDPSDPRYCQPEFYELRSASPNLSGVSSSGLSAVTETIPKVHWTRIIHVAHGLLESDWIGTPDLQVSWNDQESLYKVSWGGPEAAWRNMDRGNQWDLDPQFDYTTEEGKARLAQMDAHIEEMRHNLRRDIKTSGVKVNPLTSQVDKYGSNAETSVKLIAGAHGIPYTLLLGEELGLRAGEQNRENINILVQSRRKQFGTPLVRQLQDRLIEFGGLPKPRSKSGNYQVVWGVEEELSEGEKGELGKTYADANLAQSKAGGGLLYTTNEIRDKVGDGPISVEEEENEEMVEGVAEEEEDLDGNENRNGNADGDVNAEVDASKLARMVEWFEREMVK